VHAPAGADIGAFPIPARWRRTRIRPSGCWRGKVPATA